MSQYVSVQLSLCTILAQVEVSEVTYEGKVQHEITADDTIHSSVICHTTGPQPLPKRFLHLMR
jgi:hypothetical protein